MEHFYQNIHGWFSYENIYAEVAQMAEDGDLIVEIGSFKGKSTAFMCVEIANSGKKVQFDCIDPMVPMSHYAESAKNEADDWADYTVDKFHERLEPVKGLYNLIQKTSAEAAAQYADKSIDFIMIDGDHTYQGVYDDVVAFLPKMKSGGIMTGDDAWDAGVWKAVNDAAPDMNVQLINGNLQFYIEVP